VFLAVFSNDLTTNINAVVTNVDRRASNKLFNTALTPAAETAAQLLIALSHCPMPSMPRIEVVFSTETRKLNLRGI
jgi:hypothetical protein